MVYILKEMLFGGYKEINLQYLYIIAVLFGILVITSKNPIISVLFLIGLFLDISGYLILIGLTFIGLAYLLVYIGAVSILFLFILMLINIRISDLSTDNVNSIPLGVLLGSFFHFFINSILPSMMMSDDNLLYSISRITKLANVTSVC
jgi:NADH-ubiquinone oxidoreductase chain 6